MTWHYVAYAKLNLYLAVLGKRPDGYHDIDTVLQTVDLGDRLTFETAPDGVLETSCDLAEVPCGEGNLVWQALALLRNTCRPQTGLRVAIEKRIPVQAGLGGGSSNAACALCAANRIWRLGLGAAELERLGAQIGSDVPFFVRGGTQRCRGRGERTEGLTPLPDSTWLIAKPPWGLSTAEVYREAAAGLTSRQGEITMLLGSLAKRDLTGTVRWMFNDLESAAQHLRPDAGGIRAWMAGLGLRGVTLAGSGSAWVGFCPDPGSAAGFAAAGLARGWRIDLVRPVKGGWIEAVT